MPAIVIMKNYNMTKISRFAVKLFFISFEPSASIVLVAAPIHRLSYVSQCSDY